MNLHRSQLYKNKRFHVRILIGGEYMNNKELQQKINNAMYTLMKEKGVCTPVDVLMSIGVLSQTDYERWRTGKIDYLERV